MRRIRRGWTALRANRRKGVSLIVALCASALLLGLTLSLICSSALLMARADRKIGRERCYQLAQSMAQVLDKELRRYHTDRSGSGVSAGDLPSPDGTFYKYADQILDNESYRTYDPADPERTTYYVRYDAGDEGGTFTLRLRKLDSEDVKDTVPPAGTFPYESREAQTTALENARFITRQFQVDVASKLDGEEYSYSSEYYRKDGFQVDYTWQSSDRSMSVYWNGGAFYWDATFQSQVVPLVYHDGEGNETGTESVTIGYAYNTNIVNYKEFQPAYLEGRQDQQEGGGTDENGQTDP